MVEQTPLLYTPGLCRVCVLAEPSLFGPPGMTAAGVPLAGVCCDRTLPMLHAQVREDARTPSVIIQFA